MSDAQREVVNSLLDSLYGQFKQRIAASRGVEETRLAEIIDRGFLWGEGLKQNGLVYELWYVDQGLPLLVPAFLSREARTIPSGQRLELNYRIWVHSGLVSPDQLERKWRDE